MGGILSKPKIPAPEPISEETKEAQRRQLAEHYKLMRTSRNRRRKNERNDCFATTQKTSQIWW